MTRDEFPGDGVELTHILVVEDAARARDFYVDVLGAELYREYGGTSVVLRAFGTWLLLVRDLAAAGHRGWADARQAGGDLCSAGRPEDRRARNDDPGARLPGDVRHAAGTRRRVPHPAGGL
jgi:catechol 2,3-dioxygenase-like lactoylglutathione lyase family enzyme